MKGSLVKLLVAVVIILAALNHDKAGQILGKLYAMVPGVHAVPDSQSAGEGTAPDAGAGGPAARAQSAVEAYMRQHATPDCTLSFIDWSDFSTSGPVSAITLHYRVQQPGRQDAVASVRFTVQGGRVAGAQIVATPARLPSVGSFSGQPVLARITPPPVVIDRFSGPIMAAEHGPRMTMHLTDAYSLAQLDQAKAQARAERKPLGFVMVWGQFFGVEEGTREQYGESALVHFYQVFHQSLVLVFVRHESELGQVPPAVRKGFFGPDEGGYAPNMAVTDASATEFIVEIPDRNLDGAGRDPLFAAGGQKIDQWLATHPDAMTTRGTDPQPEQ